MNIWSQTILLRQKNSGGRTIISRHREYILQSLAYSDEKSLTIEKKYINSVLFSKTPIETMRIFVIAKQWEYNNFYNVLFLCDTFFFSFPNNVYKNWDSMESYMIWFGGRGHAKWSGDLLLRWTRLKESERADSPPQRLKRSRGRSAAIMLLCHFEALFTLN